MVTKVDLSEQAREVFFYPLNCLIPDGVLSRSVEGNKSTVEGSEVNDAAAEFGMLT